jgi:ATP-binding cassette subfamily B protein
VGATGSGKTTLALLLCRFYDPAAGVIMLNGCDLKNYNLKELRNRFSLVFQDTFLFSASIRDNIIYGRPDAVFEDVVHAATVAGIHEHIMNMPEGYDTVVGERGVTLSGG